MSEPTQEQLNQFSIFKHQMITSLLSNFNNFMASVQHIPVTQKAMNNALHHFDTALLWVREGIESLPLNIIEQPETPKEGENAELPIEGSQLQ